MRFLTLAAIAVLLLIPSTVLARQRGVASYYDDGPGLYAAVPSYSFGDPRYQITVCDDEGDCVEVTVRDHCNCYVGTADERMIDLSPAAFAALEPLSRGVMYVTIGGSTPRPNLTPPPTDTSTGQVLWSSHDRACRFRLCAS